MSDDILPTMRNTVAWLQALGFQTTDSGDGVTNVAAGMECALTFPHVFMVVDPDDIIEDTDRLYEACRARNLLGPTIRVESSYNPEDRIAVLGLYGVTDQTLR